MQIQKNVPTVKIKQNNSGFPSPIKSRNIFGHLSQKTLWNRQVYPGYGLEVTVVSTQATKCM